MAEADKSEDLVILEFFDKTTGEDRFTVELSREDFDKYSAMAEELSVPIDEFIVNLVESEVHDRNTQWYVPELVIDENGNEVLVEGNPVDLSNLAGSDK